MRTLIPFQITKTANNGVATRLSAVSRKVFSAQIVPKEGNAATVLIGGTNDPKTDLALILPLTKGHNYDLYDLWIKTGADGDGVEIFGFE